jgi:hypothetical protein
MEMSGSFIAPAPEDTHSSPFFDAPNVYFSWRRRVIDREDNPANPLNPEELQDLCAVL